MIFGGRAVVFHSITSCVTHLYVLNFIGQVGKSVKSKIWKKVFV